LYVGELLFYGGYGEDVKDKEVQKMSDKVDFEVIEPKDYASEKETVYSHSTLVMSALKKARDNRSQEMRDGYSNVKFDKFGNAHKVYIPDSRQVFIESVESLMMIQQRDFDSTINGKLNKIRNSLKKKYEDYCKKEKQQWDEMDYEIIKKYNQEGTYYMLGLLSERYLPFYKMYVRDKVDAYTKIVSLIQKLIKRLGDYREEMIET